MSSAPRILLIEDDTRLAASLREVLQDENFDVFHCESGPEGLQAGIERAFDAVLTDLRLPGMNGLDLVQALHQAHPRMPLILMTAHGTVETAIEATKFGAYEYLQKPFEMDELLAALNKAVEAGRLMREPVQLTDPSSTQSAFVGASRSMQNVCKQIGRLAASPVTVLIRGETGTGKELVARALYQHSERAKAAFIAVNCAAIPETLLESELFGHERGAFTGADRRRIGRFEQAHGGTLFLDEIGDLSPGTQAKLLRVLQERSFRRVGGNENITVDVRVLAATHCDLEAMIREGRFREDLFYRLSVATIAVPPLRERRDDIPPLIKHFIAKCAAELDTKPAPLAADARRLLETDPWPGNVRELENLVRRLLLNARGLPISADAVRQSLLGRSTQGRADKPSLARLAAELLAAARRGEISDAHGRLLAEAERAILEQAIDLAGGNQSQAARWLGLSRLTLREKLLQLGLHPRRGDQDRMGDPNRLPGNQTPAPWNKSIP